VAQAYVKAAGLEEGAPDNRTLVLDIALCDGLFKGVVKKGETFPTHLPKVKRGPAARREGGGEKGAGASPTNAKQRRQEGWDGKGLPAVSSALVTN
jgi:hypothetical protein